MPRTNRPTTAPNGVGLGQIGRGVAGGIIAIPGAVPGPVLPPGLPVATADEVVRALPLPSDLAPRIVDLVEQAPDPRSVVAVLRKMLARPDVEPLLAREVMLRVLRFFAGRPTPSRPVRRSAEAFLASAGGLRG